jgi:hypothetical protein
MGPRVACVATECDWKDRRKLAPRAGLEPTTYRLTADRSTAELPGNDNYVNRYSQAAARMDIANIARMAN